MDCGWTASETGFHPGQEFLAHNTNPMKFCFTPLHDGENSSREKQHAGI